MGDMASDTIDLIVTDPPYGYSFMGKDWDKAVPSVDIWQECLRVLKPGAFAFIMSAPRQDVLAYNLVNLSGAGFETGFTSIYWAYASGFPKAGDIGKMVDKQLGESSSSQAFSVSGKGDRKDLRDNKQNLKYRNDYGYIHELKNDLVGSYGGFQPKPAVEVIMVVMKPLSEKTYVDQALSNQKGITWLDDGRIPYQSDNDLKKVESGQINKNRGMTNTYKTNSFNVSSTKFNPNKVSINGRFPANLLVSDDVLNDGTITKSPDDYVRGSNSENQNSYSKGIGGIKGDIAHNFGDSGSFSRYFNLDTWFDTKDLSKEAQKTFPFLITPKASKSEKKGSTHPTVKPVKLFSWLMTIGSRKGDLVLDPFLGSGTVLEAGYLIGREVLGFELDPQWEHLYDVRSHKHQGKLGDWI